MARTILSSSSGSGSGSGNLYFVKEVFDVPDPVEFQYALLDTPIPSSEQVDRNGVLLSPGADRDYIFTDERTFQIHPDTHLHPGEKIQVGYWADISGMVFVEETFTVDNLVERNYTLTDYALLGFLRVAINGIQIYYPGDFGYSPNTKTITIKPSQSLVSGDTLTFRYAVADSSV